MLLGYNTNGLAHHDLESGLRLLAENGYRSVAITLDHGCLDPYGAELQQQLTRTRDLLAELNLRSVIETGARFLLDPRRKHYPSLMTTDHRARRRRIDFYRRAFEIAAALGSDCVSLWSGALEPGISEAPTSETHSSEGHNMDWLVEGLEQVMEYSHAVELPLGFEPEPGMFIDTMSRYAQLRERLDDQLFRLTLDVGHLHCQRETPLTKYIERFGEWLVNVHLEDMRQGVHEHLPFGEGEIDFPPVIAALKKVHYRGGVHVELSRDSYRAPTMLLQARQFLAPLLSQ